MADTAREIEEQLGPFWLAARRFGILQSTRLRPIDDFSQFGVNAAFGSGQRVTMRGLDHVVAWAKARLEAVSDTREFALQDETGEWWTGALHKDWSVNEWRSMVGRVADLKSAYKQLPAHPAHAAVSVIAVKDDEGDMKFFRALSLMFGTTAAVYAFLRFSRALAFLAIHFLQLTVVEFFDDFSQVECLRISESAQDSIEGLFNLLGW